MRYECLQVLCAAHHYRLYLSADKSVTSLIPARITLLWLCSTQSIFQYPASHKYLLFCRMIYSVNCCSYHLSLPIYNWSHILSAKSTYDEKTNKCFTFTSGVCIEDCKIYEITVSQWFLVIVLLWHHGCNGLNFSTECIKSLVGSSTHSNISTLY